MVGEVQAGRKINLSLGTDQRAGDQVLNVRNLSKAFDSKRLWDGSSWRFAGANVSE